MKILLLSDTHGYLDDAILKYARASDEIWHAGDFGSVKVSDVLSSIKKLRGVYGNVDNSELRLIHPEQQVFDIEGFRVMMIHIGGYPGTFPSPVREQIKNHKPDIFICGHSHILKIMRDPVNNNMLCINPGAAGKHGFHQVRTMIRFSLSGGKIQGLEVIELGSRV